MKNEPQSSTLTLKSWYMAYKPIKKICVGCGVSFMAKRPTIRFCTNVCSKSGEHSHRWKGEGVGIDALHTYMRKAIPKPTMCQCCQKEPPRDLANISNEYKRDVSDWEWLCRRCHMSKDGRLNNLKQFEFKKDLLTPLNK